MERYQQLVKSIQNIGFEDEYQFAFFRLFGIDQRLELAPKTEENQEKILEAFAQTERSLNDYLQDELIAYLKEEIANFEQKIQFFEQKYQMSWEEMGQKFDELNQFGIIEKEDDYLDWVTAMDFKEATQKSLSKIYWAYYQEKIKVFEQKYQMNFEKFCEIYLALDAKNLYENELVAMEWESYEDLKKYFEKLLN